MKPRLLFFPFPLLSHYMRCLALASELRDDFEILFLQDKKFSSLVYNASFETFPCINFDAEVVMNHAKRFDFGWMKTHVIEETFLAQSAAIEKFQPHAVLGDASFTLKMAAEKTGTKMIAIINGYMSRYYALTRRISRTHSAYRYSKKLPSKLFDALTRSMESLAFHELHASFSRLRKKYHLKKIHHYLAELEGDFTLICDYPGLFPQKILPRNYDSIGPLFYEGTNPELEIISRLSSDKKTILVTLGSSGDWDAVAFLNKEPFSIFNIITAGDEQEILDAPHIIHKRFLNNTALLPYCDLMICHGGNGSVCQALAYDVPILAHTNIFEQEWNMQQVKAMGYGDVINEIQCDTELMNSISHWMGIKNEHHFAEEYRAFKKNRYKTFMRVWQLLNNH